jgi:type I restriction enzyme S subunit
LRPYLNKVVLPNDNGYATSELVPFAPNYEINRYFLAYLLRSDSFVAFIDAKSGGAKMPRASMDVLRNFNLIKPPIELQNQFAEFVKLIDKSKFVGHSKYFL